MTNAPKLIRAPLRDVHGRIFMTARWDGYRPRTDDIIISTYPKSGTTWMQRIVCLLVRQSTEPLDINDVSPWPDMRVFEAAAQTHARAEAQTHRRFYKSHLPYDGLPVYEGVKFIHVARDGRDAAMSFHNHQAYSLMPPMDQIPPEVLADMMNDTKFPLEIPAPPSRDPAEFFAEWVRDADVAIQGDSALSYFHMENSFWAERANPNVLLVHYNDLKADRAGEMRRIAAFLNIDIPAALWPQLIEAASFERMRAESDALVPVAQAGFDGGAKRFIYKGTNGRWRGAVRAEDLALYDARVKAEFAPELARWLECGRLADKAL